MIQIAAVIIVIWISSADSGISGISESNTNRNILTVVDPSDLSATNGILRAYSDNNEYVQFDISSPCFYDTQKNLFCFHIMVVIYQNYVFVIFVI